MINFSTIEPQILKFKKFTGVATSQDAVNDLQEWVTNLPKNVRIIDFKVTGDAYVSILVTYVEN